MPGFATNSTVSLHGLCSDGWITGWGRVLFALSLAGMAFRPAWAGPPTVESRLSLSGTVTGPDGLPTPGARVFYAEREGDSIWGKVAAEAVVDPKGRFQLTVSRAKDERLRVAWGTLWAYRPGSLIGLFNVREGALPPGVPVRLVVGPPAISPFEVRGPDGRPIAGATITPRVLFRQYASVPDGLADLIAADTRTDQRGRAVLTAVFPEEVSTVVVTAPGFGSQQFGFAQGDIRQATRVVTLIARRSPEGPFDRPGRGRRRPPAHGHHLEFESARLPPRWGP